LTNCLISIFLSLGQTFFFFKFILPHIPPYEDKSFSPLIVISALITILFSPFDQREKLILLFHLTYNQEKFTSSFLFSAHLRGVSIGKIAGWGHPFSPFPVWTGDEGQPMYRPFLIMPALLPLSNSELMMGSLAGWVLPYPRFLLM
jgi:hypothetical protein